MADDFLRSVMADQVQAKITKENKEQLYTQILYCSQFNSSFVVRRFLVDHSFEKCLLKVFQVAKLRGDEATCYYIGLVEKDFFQTGSIRADVVYSIIIVNFDSLLDLKEVFQLVSILQELSTKKYSLIDLTINAVFQQCYLLFDYLLKTVHH